MTNFYFFILSYAIYMAFTSPAAAATPHRAAPAASDQVRLTPSRAAPPIPANAAGRVHTTRRRPPSRKDAAATAAGTAPAAPAAPAATAPDTTPAAAALRLKAATAAVAVDEADKENLPPAQISGN